MSNANNQTLGEIILEAIKAKGLNQSKIADKMNVRRQTINQLDRRKTFDIEFLQKLKEATDLDFTGYLYRHPGSNQLNPPGEQLTNSNLKVDPSIEMSLYIKLKSDPSLMNKMGDLLMTIRKEAVKMGFTIL